MFLCVIWKNMEGTSFREKQKERYKCMQSMQTKFETKCRMQFEWKHNLAKVN